MLHGRPRIRWIEPADGLAHEWPLEPGDVAAFPAGTGIAHCVVNPPDAEADAELLVVGQRIAGERVHYAEDPL